MRDEHSATSRPMDSGNIHKASGRIKVVMKSGLFNVFSDSVGNDEDRVRPGPMGGQFTYITVDNDKEPLDYLIDVPLDSVDVFHITLGDDGQSVTLLHHKYTRMGGEAAPAMELISRTVMSSIHSVGKVVTNLILTASYGIPFNERYAAQTPGNGSAVSRFIPRY